MKRKRTHVWWLLLVLLIGAMLGLWQWGEAPGTPRLFSDLPVAETPARFSKQSIAKRHRWVRLDELGVRQLSLNSGEEKRVVLNLFPDLEVEATIKVNRTNWNNDQSAFGLIEDNPDTHLIVSRHEDVMMGVVVLPDGRQVFINHAYDGKYVIVEVDPAKVGGCGTCVTSSGSHPALPQQKRKARIPAGVKTGAVPGGTWARRLAMADPEVLKKTAADCRECQTAAPGARVRPLLAAMGVPGPLLAAVPQSNATLRGRSGISYSGPAATPSFRYPRPGVDGAEIVDVLFIYNQALYNQELPNAGNSAAGALLNMEVEANSIIDFTNDIFSACGIPLEARRAGSLVPGRYRSVNATDFPRGYNPGGGNKPQWKTVQAPVQQDRTARINVNGFMVPNPPAWTVWAPTVAGQQQALVGIYEPAYEDLDNLTWNDGNTMVGYLDWIYDGNNSLLYGDQYWGNSTIDLGLPDGSVDQVPYINLPEGFLWRLTPPEKTVLGAIIPFNFQQGGPNRALLSGPVDHPNSSHTFTPAAVAQEDNVTIDASNGVSPSGNYSVVIDGVEYNATEGTAAEVIAGTADFTASGGDDTALVRDALVAKINAAPGVPVTAINTIPATPGDFNLTANVAGTGFTMGNATDDATVGNYIQANNVTPNVSGIDILVEGTTPNLTHDVVQRYDDGTNTGNWTYGGSYDLTYSGVLGLRMDLNGIDYAGLPFTGDPWATTRMDLPHYPVLHGQTGGFNSLLNPDYVETPECLKTYNSSGAAIAGSHSGHLISPGNPDMRFIHTDYFETGSNNSTINKNDARADIVCILVDDALPNWSGSTPATATNWDGLADKFNNMEPTTSPAHIYGRGPNPGRNGVQQFPYDWHDGLIIAAGPSGTGGDGRADAYIGGFTSEHLTPVGVVERNSTATMQVAYYPFVGTAIDKGGHSYHGSVSDPAKVTLTTDRHGNANQAYHFDGTGGSITATIPTGLTEDKSLPEGDKNRTVSAWVKVDDPNDANDRFILGWGGLTGTFAAGNSYGFFKTGSNWSAWGDVNLPDPPDPNNVNGNWTHLVSTYMSGATKEYRLYVNGIQVQENLTASAFTTAGNTLKIGAGAGPNPFHGAIDDIRIFGRAFTEADVKKLYIAERPTPVLDATQGLVAYYPFTDGSLVDSSPPANNPATTTGTTAAAVDRHNSPGNNDAYEFNGTGTITTAPNSNGFPADWEDFTLSLWVNPMVNFGGGTSRTIVANNSDRFVLSVKPNTGSLGFSAGPGYNPAAEDHVAPMPAGQSWDPNTWYHVVVKSESNTTRIFRDGELWPNSSTKAYDGNTAFAVDRFLTLGNRPAGASTDDLHGAIDEVRLYNRALSDTEVNNLYWAGYPFPGPLNIDMTDRLAAWYPMLGLDPNFVLDRTASLLPPYTNPFPGPDYPGGGIGRRLARNNAPLTEGRFGATDIDGAIDFNATWASNLGAPGSTWLDSQHAGGWQVGLGNATTSVPDVTPTTAFTISFWANLTQAPGMDASNPTAALFGNSFGDQDGSWRVEMDSAGLVGFRAKPVGAAITVKSSNPLVLDEWHHVIITRDDGTGGGTPGNVQFYLDGEPSGNPQPMSVALPVPNTPAPPRFIVGQLEGREAGVANMRFTGKLDEIRIYPGRHLSQAEAEGLYAAESPEASGSATIKVNLDGNYLAHDDRNREIRLELFSNDSNQMTLTGTPVGPFTPGVAITTASPWNATYSSTGGNLWRRTVPVSPGTYDPGRPYLLYSFDASNSTFFNPVPANSNAWQDLQGEWSVNATAASAWVESVEITIRDNTFVYRGTIFPPNSPVADEYAKLAQMNRDRTFGMVCRYTKAMAGYTFAHEMGHLLGCHHALGDSAKRSSALQAEYAEVTFSPYGREETGTYTGFTLGTGNSVRDEFLAMGNHFLAAGNGTAMGRYATIMATPVPGVITRIPRFANPSVHWRGRSTGDNHGRHLPPPLDRRRPMYHDQVRAIKLIGPIVARYRDQTGTFRQDERLRGGWNATDPTGGDMAAGDSPGFPTGVPDSVVVPGTKKQPARGGLADSSGGGAAGRRPGSGARPAGSAAGGTSRPRKGISASTRPSANPPGTRKPVTSTNPPVVKPNPGGVGARPPGPPGGGGNPGAPVRNDTRRRSQPMVVRMLADRSYLATINGHNLGATGGGDAAMRTDDARPVFHGRSVWWHLVVPADGDYELQADTRGSAIDTTLAVWLPGAARPLANDNDPRQPGPASAVRVRRRTLSRGQTIELVVDGVNGAQGQVQLNVRLKPIRR